MAEIWRVDPTASISWHSFVDAWVVFDNGSGQTHRLDALTAAVLDRLCEGQATADDIVAHLAAAGVMDVPELGALVLASLENLHDVSLADRGPV
jgi:PqqD family protein of HPr-rel-A system